MKTTNWTHVPNPNDIWPNASLSPLLCFIKELIHSFPNTTQMQEVSRQINKISNQQNPPDKEQPRDFKCTLTVMEILNKLWAVFACLLQYTLICCLFYFKWALEPVRCCKYYRWFTRLMSNIRNKLETHISSTFPYCKNTGRLVSSLSSTPWWQWKTVKIDGLIKGTSGTWWDEKKN